MVQSHGEIWIAIQILFHIRVTIPMMKHQILKFI